MEVLILLLGVVAGAVGMAAVLSVLSHHQSNDWDDTDYDLL